MWFYLIIKSKQAWGALCGLSGCCFRCPGETRCSGAQGDKDRGENSDPISQGRGNPVRWIKILSWIKILFQCNVKDFNLWKRTSVQSEFQSDQSEFQHGLWLFLALDLLCAAVRDVPFPCAFLVLGRPSLPQTPHSEIQTPAPLWGQFFLPRASEWAVSRGTGSELLVFVRLLRIWAASIFISDTSSCGPCCSQPRLWF